MSGLMGALLSGGAQGYGRGVAENTQNAQATNMQQMQMEIAAMRDARIRENTIADRATERTQNMDDARTSRGEKFVLDEAAAEAEYGRRKGLINESAKIKPTSAKDQKNPAAWLGAGTALTKQAEIAEMNGDPDGAATLRTQSAEMFRIAMELQGGAAVAKPAPTQVRRSYTDKGVLGGAPSNAAEGQIRRPQP